MTARRSPVEPHRYFSRPPSAGHPRTGRPVEQRIHNDAAYAWVTGTSDTPAHRERRRIRAPRRPG